MRRIALVTMAVLGAVQMIGCTEPEKGKDAQVPEKPIQIATTEPADAPVAPNDVLSVSEEAGPASASLPPVSKAEPLPRWHYSDSSSAQPRVHVVAPRESLYAIARRYYGDQKQWRRIYQANKNRISDPDRIEVGMKLIIP